MAGFVSVDTKTAELINSPSNIALTLVGGSITMDSGQWPHVTGIINIAMPSLATLNLLDPRLGKRIQVVLARTNPVFSRTFNLLLVERSIDQQSLVVSLRVTSDETLLGDYLATADDDTPLGLATSLRSVINYVLGTAISGAALAASPSTDVDVHPTWQVTNLHTNPDIVNTYGFGAGSNASSLTRVTFGTPAALRWTATAAGDSNLVVSPAVDTFRVQQGTYYTFQIEVRSDTTPRLAQLGLQFWNSDTVPMQTYYGASQTTSASAWKTYTITARAPVGATSVTPIVFTYGSNAGQYHYVEYPLIYAGDRGIPVFTGSFASNADYDFAWTDSAHGSPSIRIPLNETASPDAFIWRAGVSAMDFLQPLFQAEGLRLVCNEARVWTLRNDAYRAPFSFSVTYATDMLAPSADTLNRDNDAWFDGAVTVYEWTDRDGIPQRMVDEYTPGTPTKMRRFNKSTPYPGPGFSQYAVTRAARRGRQMTASKVYTPYALPDQSFTVTPYITAAEVGVTQSVNINLDTDEMTIMTRTDA